MADIAGRGIAARPRVDDYDLDDLGLDDVTCFIRCISFIRLQQTIESPQVRHRAKFHTLLDKRMDNEITPDDYAIRRRELQERQTAINFQTTLADRDNNRIADLAIKAFELSQSLASKWVKSKYNAKRTILSIVLETVRLNSGNIEFSLRKPFKLLQDVKDVPLSGAMGI